MPQELTSRRRRCRPDRAQRHAELADYARVEVFVTLRGAVVDAGGLESWDDLMQRITAARAELGERTSVVAAVLLLTALYTLHRMNQIGFRGLIGSAVAIAERTSEVLGWGRGFGERTLRGAARILEAADLVERRTHGRGRQVELEPEAEGEEPRKLKRSVLSLTLTTVAVSYWAARRRNSNRGPDVGAKPTPANLADNTIGGERELSLSRDARPSITSAGTAAQQLNAVSPVGDVVSLAALAAASEGEGSARAVPRRMVPWRPSPTEPNDWGTATRAVLYDLETTLLHHRRDDRPRIVGLARAELDPGRRIAGLGEGTPPGGSGLPWDDWVWRWRGMPLADRRVACERALLPALVGHLRRLELWEIAPDRDGGRPRPGQVEPGPRQIAERNAAPPDTVIVEGRPPPRLARARAAPAAPPPPKPDWLINLERRYGGEEV